MGRAEACQTLLCLAIGTNIQDRIRVICKIDICFSTTYVALGLAQPLSKHSMSIVGLLNIRGQKIRVLKVTAPVQHNVGLLG